MNVIKKRISDYVTIFKILFTPTEVCECVEDIVLESLYHKGYRTILLDVDNTLLTYSQRKVSLQKINWVQKCRKVGFRVFVVSNNLNHKRLLHIAEQISVFQGIYFACKPFPFGVRDLVYRYHIDLDRSVVIGDQLFTDIVGGNWLNCYTILVDPIDKKLSFLKTVQRDIELFLLRQLSKIY